MTTLVHVLFCLLASFSACGDSLPRSVQLRSGREISPYSISLLHSRPAVSSGSLFIALVVDEARVRPFRARFLDPLSPSAVPRHVLQSNAFLVRLDSDALFAEALSYTSVLSELRPSDKSVSLDYPMNPLNSTSAARISLLLLNDISFDEASELYGTISGILGVYGDTETAGHFVTLLTTRGSVRSILSFVVSDPNVLWADVHDEISLLNYYAGEHLLGGEGTYDPETRVFTYPLWRNGLTGSGQIVSVFDTKVQEYHCFFHDDTVSNSQYQPRRDLSKIHRKIVYFDSPKSPRICYYWTGCRLEHGTHVAGTIAGQVREPGGGRYELEFAQGIAPEAKLVLFDLLGVKVAEVPSRFGQGYKHGARVFSNSWGLSVPPCNWDCDCGFSAAECQALFGVERCCEAGNQYDALAFSMDEFIWKHPDAVLVFAAGNSGHYSRYRTLNTPAVAKNVIAVGASVSATKSFIYGVRNLIDWEDRARVRGFQSSEECCQSNSYLRNLCCPDVAEQAVKDRAGELNENNLAFFSSRGPAFDGRWKPDVVAPGHFIFSAHALPSDMFDSPRREYCAAPHGQINSNPELGLKAQAGTSMSVPVVSGLVTLIRQYLADGFSGPKKEPSAALVKAVLIASSRLLTGGFELGDGSWEQLPHSDAENAAAYMGFGMPHLEETLNLDEFSNAFYAYEETIQSKSDLCYEYRFAVTSNDAMFSIAMAYTDLPANPMVAHALVNDLDLIVIHRTAGELANVCNGGRIVQTHYGNGHEEADRVNNVEKVSLVEGSLRESDCVVVRVCPWFILTGSQPFGLAVTGHGFEPLAEAQKRVFEIVAGVGGTIGIVIAAVLACFFWRVVSERVSRLLCCSCRSKGVATKEDF